MEPMKIRNVLIIAMLCVGTQAFGQFGLSAGASVLRPFGAQKTFVGGHLSGEYSLDDVQTYFGRVSIYPGISDQIVNLGGIQEISTGSIYPIDFTTKTNYTIISGGARYYLGDGYETGLAAYGGSTLNVLFNSVKAQYEEFDETKFILSEGFTRKSNVFGFGAGLQGGVKYGIIGLGTVYMDLGVDYLFALQASNQMANYSPYLSNILFQINVGFRKDIGGF